MATNSRYRGGIRAGIGCWLQQQVGTTGKWAAFTWARAEPAILEDAILSMRTWEGSQPFQAFQTTRLPITSLAAASEVWVDPAGCWVG